jgi:hypothetical protein
VRFRFRFRFRFVIVIVFHDFMISGFTLLIDFEGDVCCDLRSNLSSMMDCVTARV